MKKAGGGSAGVTVGSPWCQVANSSVGPLGVGGRVGVGVRGKGVSGAGHLAGVGIIPPLGSPSLFNSRIRGAGVSGEAVGRVVEEGGRARAIGPELGGGWLRRTHAHAPDTSKRVSVGIARQPVWRAVPNRKPETWSLSSVCILKR